jgi:hypothetical protein
MSSPSWRPLNSLGRGKGERVDFDRASWLTVVFECLSLAVFFSWPFKDRVGHPSFQFYLHSASSHSTQFLTRSVA